MAKGIIKNLLLKQFKGINRANDGGVIDLYADIGYLKVELYEVDNSKQITNDNEFYDVRRSFKGYIGILRRFKLQQGKYILKDENDNIYYSVDKANIVGNKTFLKLSVIEGF